MTMKVAHVVVVLFLALLMIGGVAFADGSNLLGVAVVDSYVAPSSLRLEWTMPTGTMVIAFKGRLRKFHITA